MTVSQTLDRKIEWEKYGGPAWHFRFAKCQFGQYGIDSAQADHRPGHILEWLPVIGFYTTTGSARLYNRRFINHVTLRDSEETKMIQDGGRSATWAESEIGEAFVQQGVKEFSKTRVHCEEKSEK